MDLEGVCVDIGGGPKGWDLRGGPGGGVCGHRRWT